MRGSRGTSSSSNTFEMILARTKFIPSTCLRFVGRFFPFDGDLRKYASFVDGGVNEASSVGCFRLGTTFSPSMDQYDTQYGMVPGGYYRRKGQLL